MSSIEFPEVHVGLAPGETLDPILTMLIWQWKIDNVRIIHTPVYTPLDGWRHKFFFMCLIMALVKSCQRAEDI